METLYEIADLAVFLWALERKKEALAVAASIAANIPAPPPLPSGRFNYNVWCPTTFSHALLVHLGTGSLRDQAEASRAAIVRDPGNARNNPDFIVSQISAAGQLATAPAGQDTIKWECQHLARAIGSLVLYSELAKAGDTVFKPHSKAVGDLVPKLLAKLGARLQMAK